MVFGMNVLVKCDCFFMIILQLLVSRSPVLFLVSECASSSRLVGTFLSVCALTVLCGLVVVALSRLLLQKKTRTPAGTAEDGVFHCTGKVSCVGTLQCSSWDTFFW